MLTPLHMVKHMAGYLLFRKGVLTMAPVHAMAFVRSTPDQSHPDIKMQMVPMCFDPKTRMPRKQPGISVTINVSRPKAAVRFACVRPIPAMARSSITVFLAIPLMYARSPAA